ncbi:helicase HerA domain-containing protein [Bacillus arachidis]|uniref:helicase HerA domain-containing protein n=1 Tax=Bacillus arachidis TaxID=2819290 RepID=UPI00255C9C67|nr:DUF87 domain-containing protein [Bacillus arachidis]WIY59035.1 DUF87 domain-containing protein [Bacillus arachidis]
MARSKFDKELENFVEKNWKMLLGVGAIGFVWFSKDRILGELMKLVPTVVGIMRLVVLFLVLLLVIRIIVYLILHHFDKKRYKHYLIIPHIEDDVSADKLGQMIRHVHGVGRKPLDRLWKGRDWYRMMIYRPEGEKEKAHLYLGGPKDGIIRVIQAFKSAYVRAEVYEVTKEQVPFPSRKSVGGRMILKRKRLQATLSLARYKKDILPTLLNTMQEQTWIDIAFSPDNGYQLIKGIRKAEKGIKKQRKSSDYGLNTFEKEELIALNKRFSRNEVAFQVSVSFSTEQYPGVLHIKDLGSMVGSIMADVNELRYRKWRKYAVPYAPRPTYGNMMWTGSELANLLHLPNMKEAKKVQDEHQILYLEKGEEMLPKDRLCEGITLGYLKHPVQKERAIKVEAEQLTKHGAVLGQTGSGKSTVSATIMQSQLDQWIEDSNAVGSFSLIDPTSDLALIMLNRMLKAEKDGKKIDWNKVHYIRFRNSEHPIALNLLHRFPGEDTQTVINGIMTTIKSMIPGQAVQTERVLKATIGTLLSDHTEQHTTLSIPMFLSNELFREEVLENISGPDKDFYLHFWRQEVGDALDSSIQPVLNRLDLFRSTTYLRRIFGQPGFSLDILKWFDEGHIVFYDLHGMEKEEIQLIVGYIMAQYHRVVQSRPIGSKVHLTFIDEGHKVQVEILPKIIAEDRKRGLGLWFITQEINAQLDKSLARALTDIGGNFLVCRQGSNSAKSLAEVMQQKFNPKYLQDLSDRIVAVQTQQKIDGKAKNVWCTMEVPPLDRYLPDGTVANYQDAKQVNTANDWTRSKIKELEKRGKSIQEIDEEISLFLFGKKPSTSKQKKVSLEKPEEASSFEELEKSVEQIAEKKVKETVPAAQEVVPELIHQAQIIPFRKQPTTESAKEEKQSKESVEIIEESSSLPDTSTVEIKVETQQEEASIFDSWEKE